jgi:rubrerythrin
MTAAWFCPACQKHHAPHVETCPGPAAIGDVPFRWDPNTSLPGGTTPTTATGSWRCPECGKPPGQCDPDGVGHYRG